MIHESLLDAIGNTPVVRLTAFSSEHGVHAYAKLESLNPGGSHKVRIALGMILDAERKGILSRGQGQTLIEPHVRAVFKAALLLRITRCVALLPPRPLSLLT